MVIAGLLELWILDAEVARTKGESVKESTKKNLLTHLNAYLKFCERYHLVPFPADNHQLCRFGQFLARSFESAESVGNYQSGVRTFHVLLGLQYQIPRKNSSRCSPKVSGESCYMK